MTSRGRPNLAFKGRPWEVDLGCAQDVLRMFPKGPSEYSNLHVQNFFSISKRFLQNLFDCPNLHKSI